MDILERNVQVQYMTSIYTQSHRTVIWLGEAHGPDDPIVSYFAFVQGTRESRSRHANLQHWNPVWKTNIYQNPNTKPSLWHKLSRRIQFKRRGDPLEVFRRDLKAFVSHEYWTRIWTCQEYVLPKNTMLVRSAASLEPGNDALSLLAARRTHMTDPCCSINFPAEGDDTEQIAERLLRLSATKDDPSILGLEGEASATGGLDILKTHRIGGERKATKSVDHVYGLLGLLSESIRGAITVDYALPVSTVFQNTTEVAITHSGNLAMVELAALHVQYGSKTTDLPSWVVDWAAVEDTPLFGETITSAGLFAAAKDKTTVFNVLSNGRAVVHGARVSQVTKVAPPLHDSHRSFLASLSSPEGATVRHKKHAIQFFQQAELAGVDFGAKEAIFSPTDEQKHAIGVFWLTLLTGHTWVAGKQEPSTWIRERIGVEEAYSIFRTWRSWMQYGFPADFRDWPRDSSFNLSFFISAIMLMMNRGFYLLDNGSFVCGCGGVQEGDWIAVLYGLDMPCVLREVGGSSDVNGVNVRHYNFIGTAYMHGIMGGEIIDQIDMGALQDEDFMLV